MQGAKRFWKKKEPSMKIVIVGGGKVGFAIAQEVSAEGHDVTIIDSSRTVCE